ncbi:hypothetical protein [Phocaeicola sp.]|uniref:hypothetical protein n=1 Tax=Phocaeicola sp. TaxID=2773926 RepID=UPI003AAE3371
MIKNLDKYWEAIVNMMDDDIRECVADELAPCTNEEFLKRYLELDPEFQDVLDSEF